MKFFFEPKSTSSGMTILEVVVVMAILGILSAIVAPSWVTFANRQRANRAADHVLQVIRDTQADAKRTRRSRELQFSEDANGHPILEVNGLETPLGEGAFIGRNGDLIPDIVSLSFVESADSNPSVVPLGNGTDITFEATGGLSGVQLPVHLTVAVPANSDNPTKKCVVIRSLLGATETGRGDECQS